jgi:hypothetical protein
MSKHTVHSLKRILIFIPLLALYVLFVPIFLVLFLCAAGLEYAVSGYVDEADDILDKQEMIFKRLLKIVNIR